MYGMRLKCPRCGARIQFGAAAPSEPQYRGILFAQGQQFTCPGCQCVLEAVPWTLKLAMLLIVAATVAPISFIAGYLKTWSNPANPHPPSNWLLLLIVPAVIVVGVVLRFALTALIFPYVVRLRVTYNPQDPLGSSPNLAVFRSHAPG